MNWERLILHGVWAAVLVWAIYVGYKIAPAVAESVRPTFIDCIDTAGFDHTRVR